MKKKKNKLTYVEMINSHYDSEFWNSLYDNVY